MIIPPTVGYTARRLGMRAILSVGQASIPLPPDLAATLTQGIIKKLKEIPNFPGGDYNAAADWIVDQASSKGIWMWDLPGLSFLRPAGFRNMESKAKANPKGYQRALAKQSTIHATANSDITVSPEMQSMIDVGWVGDTMQDVRDWLNEKIAVPLPEGGTEEYPRIRVNPELWITLYRGAKAEQLGVPKELIRWARQTANAGTIAQSSFDETAAHAAQKTKRLQEAMKANPLYKPYEYVSKVSTDAADLLAQAKADAARAGKNINEGIEEARTEAARILEEGRKAAQAARKGVEKGAEDTTEILGKAKQTAELGHKYFVTSVGVVAAALPGFLVPWFMDTGWKMAGLIGVGAALCGGYVGWQYASKPVAATPSSAQTPKSPAASPKPAQVAPPVRTPQVVPQAPPVVPPVVPTVPQV